MHSKAEQPTFKELQYAFTQHVRNPAKHPRPEDVEARRMNIYNELLYNNVEDFMQNAYPVLIPYVKWIYNFFSNRFFSFFKSLNFIFILCAFVS